MNKKNNYKGNRTLKNNLMEIKPDNIGINPLTLMKIVNTTENALYFSKFHFNNNNDLVTLTTNKKLKLPNDSMATPPILIPQNDFLKIHQINNINDLIEYIDNNSENTFDYNNRLINCFIRSNYKDLLKNNKILLTIYLKIFKNYKDYTQDIQKYINKWFKKNNSDSFFLNLGNDLKKYLSKKYES